VLRKNHKKLEQIIKYLSPESRHTPYVLNCSYSKRHPCRLFFALVSCAVPGLSEFYPLFVLVWQPWVCAIPGAHLQGTKIRNRQGIHAEPQTGFAVVACAVPGLSVFYSLVSLDLQAWVCTWNGAHLMYSTACIPRGIHADCFLQL